MNEFSSLIFDELDAYTPELDRSPNWQDVIGRSRRQRTRRLVVVFAVASVVFGSAAGVTAALGGFDAWLNGTPGKPAPKGEQDLFAAANRRSLSGFPNGTKLRELIRTTVEGKTYVLFGFRSGSSLCLRLKAVSLGHGIGPTCASVSKVLRSPPPIVAVAGVDGFQDRHGRQSAVVSFGLAADGVARVDVHAVDGTHRAALGGNAYLWVENEPDTGNRALSLSAVGTGGARVTVPVSVPFGLFGVAASPARPPRGPARVQRRIENPTVAWFVRGEPRGLPYGPGTRLVRPDPHANVLVGLAGKWCLLVVQNAGGPGTGCTPGREFWARGPLNLLLTSEGDQFVRVNGVAADGVSRVVVFLAGGETQQASLRDNLFTTLVSSAGFPARVVAYDDRGRVVGVQTWQWNSRTDVPKGARRLQRVASIKGPNGTTAVAYVGREVRGYQCWRVSFSTGQTPDGCIPRIVGSPLWIDLVQPAGGDLFVVGHAHGLVQTVQLEFADGAKVRTRPRSGLFVIAIPRAQLRLERQAAFVFGYTSQGLRLHGRQTVLFKMRR